jgi:5-methyltetrahydrofolate--homocysteine methyltransferase
MTDFIASVYNAILDGQQKSVSTAVQAALDAGVDPTELLNQGMIAAMTEVGRLFEQGDYFVPEMLVSARAMQAGLEPLKPVLMKSNFKPSGKIIIGTVKGDLHDIGKNLVAMMLEGSAFELVDLGVDVPPEKFVDAVKHSDAQVVAMSALLTTTMPNMKATIEALKQAGLRDQIKVIVGGAPITQEYADSIGADGFAPDASRAVSLAKSLVG